MFYEGNFSIDFGGGSGGSGGGGGGSEEMFPQDTYSRLEVGGDDDEAPDVMELVFFSFSFSFSFFCFDLSLSFFFVCGFLSDLCDLSSIERR